MQRTIVPGVFMWSAWQPERNMYFNSFFIDAANAGCDDGNLVIDPLALGDDDAAQIAQLGGIAWIAITNRDHERAAREIAARFGAKIVTSVAEAPLLGGTVDRTVAPGERLFGAYAIPFQGLKTPGEFALYFPALRAIVVGDALWGDPAGSVRIMPDEKLADPARAVRSLRVIASLRPEHLLLGDGTCIFGQALPIVQTMLEGRAETYVNMINRDDLPWRVWEGEPENFGGRSIEIGDYIGAQKLGYRLVEIAPHHMSAPLHWHACEEELFVVLSGAATLVTPRGEWPLRVGDYVAFPTRPQSAHKVRNDTEEPCEILMIANVDDEREVCFYPDSQKLLVYKTDAMVRDHPQLNYWEGE